MTSLETLSSCEIKRIIRGIVANYKYHDHRFTLELRIRLQTTMATIVNLSDRTFLAIALRDMRTNFRFCHIYYACMSK